MSDALAQVRGLRVAYTGGDGAPALSALDLDVFDGEKLAIIGESGSGKSTLAYALAGLLPAAAVISGRIEWPSLGRSPRSGLDIGFVFQDAGASLNPLMRVGHQVAEVARTHLGLRHRAARAEARALFERVRLPEPDAALNAYPHQLSGGQRQRVAIAAAIAARPRLLIADEPTSALDTVVQAEIVTLLEELVGQDGMTLVFITHDVALASGFVDRIAVLHSGRLVEVGDPLTLLTTPQQAYTAGLIGSHIGLETPPLIGARPG